MLNSPNIKLSIAVPVYNGERYLPQSLGSIASALDCLTPSQRSEVEVVVCDNHSNDNTRKIAEKYGASFNLELIQPPAFYSNRCLNWRHSLEKTSGEWIMMLHADDALAPTGILNLLEQVRKPVDPNIVLIQGMHREFKDDNGIRSRLKPIWPVSAVISGDKLRKKVLSYFCPFVPFLLIRRSAYDAVNGLNPAYELLQDWDLWIRILGLGDLFYTAREVGWWRVHSTSDSYKRIFVREHLQLAARMGKLIPGLADQMIRFNFMCQIARAKNAFPDECVAWAIEGLSSDAMPLGLEEIDSISENYQAVLKKCDKTVSMNLNLLRLYGTTRLAISGTASRCRP